MNETTDDSGLTPEISRDDLDRSGQGSGRRMLPPPNYAGRAMRLRLFVLVGSLLLVLVLMEQVRDPDLWRRIGFTEQPAGSKRGEPVWTEVRIAPDDGADGGDNSILTETRDESTDLWSVIFRGLNPEQLTTIAARMVADTGTQAGSEIALVAIALDHRLGSEVTLRLEQISRISQSDRAEAVAMAEGIARTQIAWREKLRPWLESGGGGVIAADDPEFVLFDRAMRTVAIERIEDRTGPARTAEGAAWLLALRDAMHSINGSGPLPEPGIYRLMTMPSGYRAAPVRLSGRLLGIEPLSTAGNALGIEKYWVLWIGGDSGGNVPACVYLTNKPAGFPGNESGFIKCNVPVQIDGVFLKLRTYTASDRSSAVCPLILASHAKLVSGEKAATSIEAGTGQLPAGWAWIVAGLIALAAGVAWIVWRNSRSGLSRYEPEGLRASLNVLAGDDRILTHREQVVQLQERMKS